MPRMAIKGGRKKLVALNMKTTEEVRAQLEAAAEASGRSLTSEVEHRLDRSLVRDELKNYLHDLLEDSMTKAEDVARANARIADLEAQVAELKATHEAQKAEWDERLERIVLRAMDTVAERYEALRMPVAA